MIVIHNKNDWRKYKDRYNRKRFTTVLKPKYYNQIMKLKKQTHSKSLNRIINILLIDELTHPNPLNDQNLVDAKKKMIKLNEEIGKLDIDIIKVGTNLNQLTHDFNIITLHAGDGALRYFLRNGYGDLKAADDQTDKLWYQMRNDRYTLKHIDKEVSSLLQLLM